MPFLGAHMSIAGGLPLSVERAVGVGCEALQIFTKSSNQWAARSLPPEEVVAFRQAVEKAGIRNPFAHDSYLINVGTPKPDLWEKSFRALLVEAERAEMLGLSYLVMHPGAHVGAGEEAAFKSIAKALNQIHAQTKGAKLQICLEVAAGQGSCIGHKLEHLAAIIDQVKSPERIGVCLDTCHLFAAGYDLRTSEAYEKTMKEVDRTVGIDRVRCFHLNDCKKDLGCRVDRHEHIGKGKLGLEAFRFLLNDPRFADRPMVLETEKSEDLKEDVENLRVLRSLISDSVKKSPANRKKSG